MSRVSVGKRFAGALGAAFAAALLGAGPALADPEVDGIFDLSGAPGYITLGPDGNIWTTLSGAAGGEDVARITTDGTVTEFASANLSSPVGITAGPDGNLWVTQAGEVARFAPADPLAAEKFAIASMTQPRDIVAGSDGNLWAASGDVLIKIPPADPTAFTDFPIAGMSARGIDVGGNGELWIADFGSARIVSATTAGVPTFYDTGGGPQELAAGLGTQVAFANPGADPQTIGRISPGGSPLTTSVANTDPFGVALGPDRAYWFAQFASDDLGRLTATGAYTTLGGLPAGSGPRQITAGPDETLWVGLEAANKVARVVDVAPDPEPGPGPDPGPGPGGDSQPPELRLGGKRKQSSARRVVVAATCLDETCEVTATGLVSVKTRKPGAASRRRSFELRPAAAEAVAAGERAKLRLKLPRRARRQVRKTFGAKPARAVIEVTATDAAGNAAEDRRKVKLIKRRH